MSARYDRSDERERNNRNYGQRGESDYRRSFNDQTQQRYRYDDDDSDRYGRERNSESDYGQRSSMSQRRGSENNRNRYDDSSRQGNWGQRNYGDYGSSTNRGYGSSGGYNNENRSGESSYSNRYQYPTGFRSPENYGDDRQRGYEAGSDRYGSENDRGWWDRASDEVASWFGDDEARRRRRSDERSQQFRGRGPKNYRRSDERIKEDINDRLSDDHFLDASDVEVTVSNTEVTLTGSVNSRTDKRRAEDIAEEVSGVTNVENRIRVKQNNNVAESSNIDSPVTNETNRLSSSAAAGKTKT